jgi:predicted nucleic acid-binding protein
MKIVKPENFFSTIKGRHVLLDTSVFIDAFTHTKEFSKFFSQCKDNGIPLVTLNEVLFEFLKGAPEKEKLLEKKAYLEEIIEAYLPIQNNIYKHVEILLNHYKFESKSLSITDLLLGAALVRYGKNLVLMTKNITEFPTNIFELETYINLIHIKAIHNYGFYSFPNRRSEQKDDANFPPF